MLIAPAGRTRGFFTPVEEIDRSPRVADEVKTRYLLHVRVPVRDPGVPEGRADPLDPG